MMSTDPVITVAIADDQELVRTGFSLVINTQSDLHVVGLAADGAEAVSLAQSQHPDVLLMDVRMPNMDGIEATRQITEVCPDTRVIILTTFDLDEYVMAAIQAGASGFLLKDSEPETLLSSIRTVHEGNAIIAPTATRRLIEHMSQQLQQTSQSGNAAQSAHTAQSENAAQSANVTQLGNAAQSANSTQFGSTVQSGSSIQSRDSQTNDPSTQTQATSTPSQYIDPEVETLTDREREVLVAIAQGLSNQEIAEQLYIGLPTVKTHVSHIFRKINARDRAQAVVFAYENHLIEY